MAKSHQEKLQESIIKKRMKKFNNLDKEIAQSKPKQDDTSKSKK